MDGLSTLSVVAIAGVLMLFGCLRYTTAQVVSIRREIESADKGVRAYADAVGKNETAERQAMATQVQAVVNKLETDLRVLQRDAVRQDQMEASERRLHTSIGKLEAKVDKLADATNEMISMKQTLNLILTRMERVSDKMEKDSQAA